MKKKLGRYFFTVESGTTSALRKGGGGGFHAAKQAVISRDIWMLLAGLYVTGLLIHVCLGFFLRENYFLMQDTENDHYADIAKPYPLQLVFAFQKIELFMMIFFLIYCISEPEYCKLL